MSTNTNVIPDLAFFDLILHNKSSIIVVGILILALSLTLSTIDTLINAISSLIIVDGNKIFKARGNYFNFSKYFIIILSIITFVVASYGFSILYLFLLAVGNLVFVLWCWRFMCGLP